MELDLRRKEKWIVRNVLVTLSSRHDEVMDTQGHGKVEFS